MVAYYQPPPKIQREVVEVEKPVIVREREIVEKPVIIEKKPGTGEKKPGTVQHDRGQKKRLATPKPLPKKNALAQHSSRVRGRCQSGYPSYGSNGYWVSPYQWYSYR